MMGGTRRGRVWGRRIVDWVGGETVGGFLMIGVSGRQMSLLGMTGTCSGDDSLEFLA